MKNNDLKKSIFSKIEKENIKQIPRWRFLLKNYALWFLVGISILIASMAISVIVLSILQMDTSIAERASGGFFYHILLFMPYIWILLLIVFIIFGLGNLLHTRYGYRHSFLFSIVISLIICVLFGVVIYYVGGAQKIERRVHEIGAGYYAGSELRREQMWTQPDSGLLAGVPLNVFVDDMFEFELVDFTGKTWFIDTDKLEEFDKSIVNVSGKVAIIGVQIDDNVFEACEIIPLTKPGDRRELRKEILRSTGDLSNERNIFELRTNKCR